MFSLRRYQARTNAKGEFAIKGLPPGHYDLRVELPNRLYLPDPPQPATVVARGCAEEFMIAVNNGSISGRIRQFPVESPPKDVWLEVVEVDFDPKEHYGYSRVVRPASDGSFAFRGLPPGKFIVGSGISWAPSEWQHYRRLVYSQAGGNEPQVLEIRGPQHITGVELPMPERAVPRDVLVRVTNPDGSPAAGAAIFVINREHKNETFYRVPPANSAGFTFARLYEKETFEVRAMEPRPADAGVPWRPKLCSAWVRVNGSAPPETLELRLGSAACSFPR